MNIQGENSLALFSGCTDALPDDITLIYEAARHQRRDDVDSLLHEHRLAHGEPEQVAYAVMVDHSRNDALNEKCNIFNKI